ncbi:MAG: dihydrodipicolinate synthetase [Bacteroidales bacterium]|nr:dihydrodipicolinate synthetase [Bacteroidales bacterium]
MKNPIKPKGLIAAPFTPFNGSGNLNLSVIADYYSFLEKNGITGVFINGTTGEGVSLTGREKLQCLREWAKCMKNGGKMLVINLVGGTSQKDCIEAALNSRDEGLSAIAVIGPYFFRPDDEDNLAGFIAKIGESVPDLQVYYYHFPAFTGVKLSMHKFLEKISERLDNFAGIKFTFEDFYDFTLCQDYKGGHYNILWGRDECILPALATGCRGFVGSTYNYAAPLYHKLIDAYESGQLEKARMLYSKVVALISLLSKYGGITTGKAFMKIAGIDCGDFRPPVRNLSASDSKKLMEDIKRMELLQYISQK